MKKILLFLISFALVHDEGFAQSLQAHVNNVVFNIPSQGTFVETQLLIPGHMLHYKSYGGGQFQSSVQVVITYKHAEEIIQFQKYQLNSPAVSDTSSVALNLIDQKRMFLPTGSYTIDVEVKDLNSESGYCLITNPVLIDDGAGKISISDISLVDSYIETQTENDFSRAGYDIIPYVINFYPTAVESLGFYFEVYNSKEVIGENDLLITSSVIHHESEKIVTTLSRYFKKKTDSVIPVLADFNISALATGNYDLLVEVRDRTNSLIAMKKLFFQRINANKMEMFAHLDLVDVTNTFVANLTDEEVKMNVMSLIPVATVGEANYIDNIIKEGDNKPQQQFLLNFWTRKDANFPETLFEEYSAAVKVVNEEFGTPILYGFETDRGRIYLKYGPPNERIAKDREPGGVPYEIWQYYQFVNNQSDVKFVFYNPDLVSNNYALIHSNAIGEINNPKWKQMIYGTFVDPDSRHDLEDDTFRDHFGSGTDDF